MTNEITELDAVGDSSRGPSRRAVLAAAWAAPLVTLAVATPARAASGATSITFGADATVVAGYQNLGAEPNGLTLVGPQLLIIQAGPSGIDPDVEYSLNITGQTVAPADPIASVRNLQPLSAKPINVIFQNIDGGARFDVPGGVGPGENLTVRFEVVYRPNPAGPFPPFPSYTLQFSGPFLPDAFATVTAGIAAPVVPGLAITQPL